MRNIGATIARLRHTILKSSITVMKTASFREIAGQSFTHSVPFHAVSWPQTVYSCALVHGASHSECLVRAVRPSSQ